MFNIQKYYVNFMGTYPFYLRKNNQNVEKLITNLYDKTKYVKNKH